jgi:hypothetical protein
MSVEAITKVRRQTEQKRQTHAPANQRAPGTQDAADDVGQWSSIRTQASRERQLSGLKITGATVKTDHLPVLIETCMIWDFALFASYAPKVYISVRGCRRE